MAVSEYNFKHLWVALSVCIAGGLSSCGQSGSGDGPADVSTAPEAELSPIERLERGMRCNDAYTFLILYGDEAVSGLALSEADKSKSLREQDRMEAGLSDTEMKALEEKNIADYNVYFEKLPSGEPDYNRVAPGAADKVLATFFDCNTWYDSRTS